MLLSKISLIRKSLRWVLIWKSWPVFSWIKAAEAYSNADYPVAESLYEQGLKEYPEHPARFCAVMDLAYCYFKAKKFDQAIEKLNYVIRTLPTSKEAYLRLAYVYIWIGDDSEAMWLLRNALRKFDNDFHLVHLFVACLIEANAPAYLVDEASDLLDQVSSSSKNSKLAIGATKAMMEDYRQSSSETLRKLVRLSSRPGAPLAAKLQVAKRFIELEEFEKARLHLNSALKISAEYPQTLSLLAQTYFLEDLDNEQNVEYANQLATAAAQSSAWLSPRELHILAEVYHHFGDKSSALLLASKAQGINLKRSDAYLYTNKLDEFVDSLASGTLS